MGWFRVDDKLKNHPKAMKAGVEAMGFWLMAACWVAEYETDGRIPDHILPVLPGFKAVYVERLIASGLWERDCEGVRMHDYADYNPTKKEQQDKRAQWRDRQNRKRGTHAGVTRDKDRDSQGDTPECPGKGNGEGRSSEISKAGSEPAISVPPSPVSNPVPPSDEISTRARAAGVSGETSCLSTLQNHGATTALDVVEILRAQAGPRIAWGFHTVLAGGIADKDLRVLREALKQAPATGAQIETLAAWIREGKGWHFRAGGSLEQPGQISIQDLCRNFGEALGLALAWDAKGRPSAASATRGVPPSPFARGSLMSQASLDALDRLGLPDDDDQDMEDL